VFRVRFMTDVCRVVTFHIFNDQTTSQPLRQLLSCCISLYYTRVNVAKFSFIAVVAYIYLFACHLVDVSTATYF